MRRVHNHRRGLFGSTGLSVCALLVVLASMGVTAPPAAERERAAAERVLEELRARRAEDAGASSTFFAGIGLAQHIADVERYVATLLPTDVQPIDLHAALRFVARAEGLVLDDLVLGELSDPGLAVADDWIALREVQLRGRGSLAALCGFTEGLCDLGFPVVVLDTALARGELGSDATAEPVPLFDFTLTLGALERAPLAARPSDLEWDESQGEGGE